MNTRVFRISNPLLSLTKRQLAAVALAVGFGTQMLPTSAADMPNSCPVDGCLVTIISVAKSGSELAVTLEANYTPDNTRNHLHMWWGEQYTAQQVGRNASSEHGVEQGKWHRHDDYPEYITTGAASTGIREGATTLCVTAADRGHNVLDADLFHCMDVRDYLE